MRYRCALYMSAMVVLASLLGDGAFAGELPHSSNPDLIHPSVYRCARSDGRVEYTNVQKPPAKACTVIFGYASPNPARPGLAGYRVLVDSEPAVFFSTERMSISSNPRSLWVLLSYAKSQVPPPGGKSWTRVLARYDVDCVRGTTRIGKGAAYAVEGDTVVLAGGTPPADEQEAMPGTVGDGILSAVCGLDARKLKVGV